jgi:hypothetical protein
MRMALPPRHSIRLWRLLVSTSVTEPRAKFSHVTNSTDVVNKTPA